MKELSFSSNVTTLASFILICLAMALAPISLDYENYVNWCLDSKNITDIFEKDFGFTLLCKFTDGYLPIVYFALLSTAIYIKLHLFPKKIDLFITCTATYISIFFITQEVNQIRAAFASALIGLSLKESLKNNHVLAITLIMIATPIHYSSLIAIPIIAIASIRCIRDKINQPLIYTSIVLLLLEFFRFTSKIFASTINIFSNIDPRINVYINTTSDYPEIPIYFQHRIIFIFLILITATRQLKNKKDDELSAACTITSLCLILFLLLYSIPVFSWRFLELFSLPITILCAKVIIENKNNKYKEITIALFFLYITANLISQQRLITNQW